MPRILYTNSQGHAVHAHSHSGGGDFKCPKKYYWKRIEGWQPREERAALEFGKAVEAAIQFHHTKNFEPGSGVDEFKLLWFKQQDNTSLVYTEKSGDWDDHYRMGTEMLALYEQQRPFLPIDNVQFQVNIKTDLFPEDSEYHGLKYTTILDMISEVGYNHPGAELLPPTTSSSSTRKLIIDIKTSAASYYVDPRLSSLDDQLRDYSYGDSNCLLPSTS